MEAFKGTVSSGRQAGVFEIYAATVESHSGVLRCDAVRALYGQLTGGIFGLARFTALR